MSKKFDTRTKLGSASRYGARYSSSLKKIASDIEKTEKRTQICPSCGRLSLRRKGYSLWYCRKCKIKMAGGAYAPRTAVGLGIDKIVATGKAAPAEMEKLLTETEKQEESIKDQVKKAMARKEEPKEEKQKETKKAKKKKIEEDTKEKPEDEQPEVEEEAEQTEEPQDDDIIEG